MLIENHNYYKSIAIFDCMLEFLRPKKTLHVSKSPYSFQKDRQTGEQELFELVNTAKHEGSWVYILGVDTWLNLTKDYNEKITRDSVKFEVVSRALPKSFFDGGLVFYHIHPKAAFDISLKKMKKMKMADGTFPGGITIIGGMLGIPEYVAYGHLLSTFHLPSVADIETAANLAEKHGPGLHFITISNTGASITKIRNPPDGESKKLSIDEITSRYKSIEYDFQFNPRPEMTAFKPYYGLINKGAKGYIQVADLTSITSTFMRPDDHTFMRWLSTNRPIMEQYNETGIKQIFQMFQHTPDYEERINEISKKNENAKELEKISTRIHNDCSKALEKFVGLESADAYAKFQIRCMRDFYSCIDAYYAKL